MNQHAKENDQLQTALQIAVGSAAFLAGLDKFTNILSDWDKYLSPRAEEIIPVEPSTFMKAVGVIEMAAGVGVLSGRYTKISSYVTAGWLGCIVGNLLTHPGKYYDIAVRDAEMALEAYVLARLTAHKEEREQLTEDEYRSLQAA